MLISWCTAGV